MSDLVEKLTAPGIRPTVVAACVDLIEREVDQKSGLTGFAVRAGYKVIKALKPGFVAHVVDSLLPDFAHALDPVYVREGTAGADGFVNYLGAHTDEIAEVLLGVTDAKAQHAKNPTVKSTYQKMRGGAKEHVAVAVPGLARSLRPFL